MFSHQRRDTALSLSETKSHFERAGPGQRALLWLLKSNALHDLAFLAHPTFLSAVTHCLIAEDGLKYIIHWLMVKDNPLAPAPTRDIAVTIGRDNSFWRARLLVHTMEARAYWTENVMLLEDSVDTWLSVVRHLSETVPEKRVFVSPAWSAKWATQRLTVEGSGPHLSSAKFDEFLCRTPFWLSWDSDDLDLHIARLLMHQSKRRRWYRAPGYSEAEWQLRETRTLPTSFSNAP